MWPTLRDGDSVEFEPIESSVLKIGDIVLAQHPLTPNIRLVKRISEIVEKRYFIEGDNPDPLASEDSHNFGPVDRNAIMGFRRQGLKEQTRLVWPSKA